MILLHHGLNTAQAVIARAVAEAVASVLVEGADSLTVGVETDHQRERVGAQFGSALRKVGDGDDGAWTL